MPPAPEGPDNRSRGEILFLTSELPYPARGGGKLRDQHVLRLLMEEMDVELLCFGSRADVSSGSRPETPGQSSARDIPRGLRVSVVDRRKAPIWRRILYPLRPYVVNGYSLKMEEELRARANPGKLLWVSRLAMGQYVPLARRLGYRVILDEHNVETRLIKDGIQKGPLRSIPNLLMTAQLSYYESRFCETANAVVATSDIDASRLSKMAPDAMVHVIPNSVDCQDYIPARSYGGSTLFFSGTLSYHPNVEGLHWFVSEVLPRLRAHFGAQAPRIVVAGADPSPELQAMLAGAGIEVHPNPPSILPLLSDAAVVFVPIRSGSGTRLKILEAMAAGRAVVSTGKGAEGLVLSPGLDILIADSADHFTSSIVKLFENPPMRREMGDHAGRTIESRYDWRIARPALHELLTRMSDGRNKG